MKLKTATASYSNVEETFCAVLFCPYVSNSRNAFTVTFGGFPWVLVDADASQVYWRK